MMGDGLPPAAATAAAASASPGAAAQGGAPAQGAAHAAGRSNDVAREDSEQSATAFDLLMSSPPAPATPATTAGAKPDTGQEDPVADAGSMPDQLLLLLAQVTPAAATPAPQTTPAPTLPAATATATAATATAGIAGTQPSIADAPTPSTGAADATRTQAGTGETGLPPFADIAAAPASHAPQAAGSAAVPVATTAIAETAQSPSALIDASPAPPAVPPMPQGAAANALPSTAAPVAPAPMPLPQPADPAAGYDDSFGTQVSWLAEQRIGEAQIRISPEHLGTIDIRLQLDGDQVRAEFQSAHAEVRQTLEASLPRLRELLGQHGLQLAHAGVGHGRGRQENGPPSAQTSGTTSRNEGGDALPPPSLRRARGLLDVYA